MTSDELNAIFDNLLVEKNNQPVSSLGHGTHECFDLIVEFTNRLGIPHVIGNPSPFPFKDAKQIYSDFNSQQASWFYRIENTPDAVPIKGDILVWNGSYNGLFGSGPGHTALDIGKSDKSSVVAFSQNDPLGTYAHLVRYGYKNISGWIRPKVTNSQPPMNDVNVKKATQVDQSLNFLKDQGFISDNDSNHYLNGEFLALVKRLFYELVSNRKRAGILDLVVRDLGFQGDTTILTKEDIMLLIRKTYDPATIRKRTIEDCINALKGLS